jgi:hypothetical protein
MGKLDSFKWEFFSETFCRDTLPSFPEPGFGNLPRVVSSTDRVSSGDDGAPGLERSDDAGLRNGDGLLLHGFVDGGAVSVVHLVELVDEANTLQQIKKLFK